MQLRDVDIKHGTSTPDPRRRALGAMETTIFRHPRTDICDLATDPAPSAG